MIRTVDLYWAAGFLEGEGCFHSSQKYHSIIRATQVQGEPIKRLVALFGGHLTGPKPNGRPPNHQPIHEWTLSGVGGRGLMMSLYALMSPRRQEQIRVSLAYWLAAPDRIADRRRRATHCRNGHPYDGNHYKMRRVGRADYRRCRMCLTAASQRYNQRLREKAPAAGATAPPGSWLGR